MKTKDLMRVAYRVGTGEDVMAPPEREERRLRLAYDPRTAILIILIFSLVCGLVVAWTMSRPVEVLALPANTETEEVHEENGGTELEQSLQQEPEPSDQGGSLGTDDGGGNGPSGPAAPAEPNENSAVADPLTITVYVSGHVATPGVVELPSDSRLFAAIEAAGGMTEDADPNALNLARTLVDGEHILVPAPGDPAVTESAPQADGGSTDGQPAGSETEGSLVNLNTATMAELMTLPGVGPAIAGRIIDWREANGSFTRIEELMEVSGIGPATFANLEHLITV